MSYIRIYPTKNNTLFKRNIGTPLMRNGNVNTGLCPVFELMDGNGQSRIVMQFDISGIRELLLHYDFTCNLKMFDGGVRFQPILKDLKPINVFYFEEDFVQGDGWSYVDGKAVEGVSNWNKRDTVNNWGTIFNTPITSFQMQKESDDILIPNLHSYIDTAVANNVNPNFALQLNSNTIDDQTYIKFIYANDTRTIYKPYLEFTIQDNISDSRENIYATIPQRFHILNYLKNDFVGTIACRITDARGRTLATPTVVNATDGVYYIEYTPDMSLSGTTIFDIWSIDGVDIRKNVIQVKSPNVTNDLDYSNLSFWPATYYQHPLIHKGDRVKFNIMSEFRMRGQYISKDYEYRIICSNGFEMVPWQSTSVYDNKMYFYVDTTFFFEELEYELFLRLNLGDRIQTSPQTTKFRITYPGPSHLSGVSASPYDSRNIYLDRNTNC